MLRILALPIVFVFAAFPLKADEIRVLSGNAVAAPQKAAGEAFSAKTGHRVNFTFANPAVIQQKIDAGEPFEAYVIPAQFLAVLAKEGRLRSGSAHPLARVGVGVAAREAGPRYDFSTPEAFRKMLLDAKAIVYSDATTGGLSGLSVQKVLEKTGVADAVRAKAVMSPQGQALIASGEVDFGLFNVSEIPRAKGVVLAGPVPAAVQAYLDYDTGVPAANAAPEPALQLLKFLASPDARAFWQAAGIEQVADK